MGGWMNEDGLRAECKGNKGLEREMEASRKQTMSVDV